MGIIFENPNSYATTGSLISKNGVWHGGEENGATTTVQWSGWYKITVVAGAIEPTYWFSGNGNKFHQAFETFSASTISVNTYLSKGDILKFNYFLHGIIQQDYSEYRKGKWTNYTNWYEGGCNAALISLNGTPLVGAGTQPVVNNNYFGCGAPLYKSETYQPTFKHYTYPETERENIFYSREPQIANGYSVPSFYDTSYCYLDTTRATVLSISTSTQATASFRVEAIPNTVDDSYDAQIAQANYQKQMVDYQRQMLDTFKCISEELEANNIPMITVCQNQDFNVTLSFYDDMPSGRSADNLITVTNNTIGDKVINVSGRLPSKGVFSVDINGKTFIFKVLETPTTSNVTVILE